MDVSAVPKNEFMRLKQEGMRDFQILMGRYPVTILVSVFVLSFLGLLHVFSFSVTCVATGILCGACAFWMIKQMNNTTYWGAVMHSVKDLLSSFERPEIPQLQRAASPAKAQK